MSNDLKFANIFSDGASRGNPGRGGWGAIVVLQQTEKSIEDARVIELGGKEENTTNNRMELTAILEALRLAESLGIKKVLVHTDSSYSANAISKWLKGWVQNDWKTKDGKPVLNRDILECFYDLLDLIECDFKVIAGHAGIAANERCDEIATSFADNQSAHLFDGKLHDYSVSLSLEKTLDKKQSSHTKKAYSYVSEIDGKVEIHKTWEECKKRVEGKRARFKKAGSKEDETHIVHTFQIKDF